jgi:pimeloyl-ACP methyl ester carboxylesterase
MRARYPDHEGFVERDGFNVGYDVYGPERTDRPAAFLVPSSPITHARSWKALVPFISRHATVVTTDGRGTGRSDRPHDRQRYHPDEVAADLVAVADAAGLDRAVVVAHCHATPWALRLAAELPDRVAGLVAIAPGIAVAPGYPYAGESERRWEEEANDATGWALRNRSCWRTGDGYQRWLDFFFDQQLPEAHSTKQLEDTVTWAVRDTEVEAMIAEREGRSAPAGEEAEDLCRRVSCPVLVIHGADDRCQPPARGRRVAELTGGELAVLNGSGHLPHVRDPVRVNRLIIDFIEETMGGTMRTKVWTRGLSRPKRVLYLSSPIGLGHARRDVAVAQELKRVRPDVEIDWLAQHPVTVVLEAEGERIHPASRWLASESAHIASESSEHDLHCFQALGGWTRSSSPTSWCSRRSSRRGSTTWSSATRPGTSTTSGTRTRSSNAVSTSGSRTSSASCRCPTVGSTRRT